MISRVGVQEHERANQEKIKRSPTSKEGTRFAILRTLKGRVSHFCELLATCICRHSRHRYCSSHSCCAVQQAPGPPLAQVRNPYSMSSTVDAEHQLMEIICRRWRIDLLDHSFEGTWVNKDSWARFQIYKTIRDDEYCTYHLSPQLGSSK